MNLPETEKRYRVYKHTVPDGRVYIGMTCKTVKARWDSGYYGNDDFFKIIKKYGWEGIKHEIIADNLTKEEAELIERKSIAEHRSNEEKYGFNFDSGGNFGKKRCTRTKKKMSKTATQLHFGDRLHTKEVVAKRAITQTGRKLSDETKRRIGDSHRGSKSVSAKRVNQIDRYNGKIIKTWDCTMDVERALGYKNSAISRCCSGGRPTAYGYVWRYEAV